MDSSAELRAKRAGFLARFDISVPKFSKQERSVLEVSYHHQQQKDSFRLDRIERVRHHILDPVPDNTVADETKDDGVFLIASKIYDKVKHRRHLTSEELIVEAKKGNLTHCPVLPTVETEKDFQVQPGFNRVCTGLCGFWSDNTCFCAELDEIFNAIQATSKHPAGRDACRKK